jgi:hypothetical protein
MALMADLDIGIYHEVSSFCSNGLCQRSVGHGNGMKWDTDDDDDDDEYPRSDDAISQPRRSTIVHGSRAHIYNAALGLIIRRSSPIVNRLKTNELRPSSL